MDIKGIISISGKPGLHKVVSQTKNGLIAESLVDQKRFPVYSNQQISALEDISLYTYEEDVLLSVVFENLFKIEDKKATISHKSSSKELTAKFAEALPNYDQERVYISDIKKVIQWYNLLVDKGLITLEEKKEEKKEEKAKPKKATSAKKETKTSSSKAKASKPTPAKKATQKKPSPKG